MTLAKALASGLPIGAMIARESVAQAFEPGDHAATFGGNPLVTAAGKTTVETMLKEGFLEEAAKKGAFFMTQLKKLQKKWPLITQVRGLGMMIALDLDQPAKPIVLKCLERGLLVNAVQERRPPGRKASSRRLSRRRSSHETRPLAAGRLERRRHEKDLRARRLSEEGTTAGEAPRGPQGQDARDDLRKALHPYPGFL
jgi:DNA-binding transcriptional MocR family regulator